MTIPCFFSRVAGLIVTATLLQACASGGMGAIAPAGGKALPRSWVSREASGTALLVYDAPNTDQGYGELQIFEYPSLTLVGIIVDSNQPAGACADYSPSGGNKMVDQHFFVDDSATGTISEYTAGSVLPSAVLSDPNQTPVDCAVSPKTGVLAVASSSGASSSPANVALYKREQGGLWSTTPFQTITDSTVAGYSYCGWDRLGNLYVTATSKSKTTVLRQFRPGRPTFGDITLKQTLNSPGGVLWDGKNLAIADPSLSPVVVYQFQIKGTTGIETGSTTLDSSEGLAQYWIYNGTLIGPDPVAGNLDLWSYPEGGSPVEGDNDPGSGGVIVLAR